MWQYCAISLPAHNVDEKNTSRCDEVGNKNERINGRARSESHSARFSIVKNNFRAFVFLIFFPYDPRVGRTVRLPLPLCNLEQGLLKNSWCFSFFNSALDAVINSGRNLICVSLRNERQTVFPTVLVATLATICAVK